MIEQEAKRLGVSPEALTAFYRGKAGSPQAAQDALSREVLEPAPLDTAATGWNEDAEEMADLEGEEE